MDLPRRNGDAVAAAIKELTANVLEQKQRADLLQTAVSSMSERMNALEQMLRVQQMKSTGTGPTVK